MSAIYLHEVICLPWAPDGYNFSERIWNNKEKLLSELNTVMTQNIMTGAGPQKAIDTLAKKMNTSRSNAGRLVMTESAYFSSLGRQQCFKDLGVEKYEIVATLDGRTSETCRHLDGKIFDMKDFQAGVTAPPFHVHCRSTTAPYFGDDYHIGQRVAKDEEGKRYYVPGDTTYKTWEKAFVKGDKSSLSQTVSGDKIDIAIDELSPCLRKAKTGEIVSTTVEQIVPSANDFKDWEFDWTKPVHDGYDVYSIKASGDKRIQGMVALKEVKDSDAIYVGLVESAPFNNPHNPKFKEKAYRGVGGHLFAEAVKQSFEKGHDGFIYFQAKTKLKEHYKKELGAKNEFNDIMSVGGSDAEKLYKRYYRR